MKVVVVVPHVRPPRRPIGAGNRLERAWWWAAMLSKGLDPASVLKQYTAKPKSP